MCEFVIFCTLASVVFHQDGYKVDVVPYLKALSCTMVDLCLFSAREPGLEPCRVKLTKASVCLTAEYYRKLSSFSAPSVLRKFLKFLGPLLAVPRPRVFISDK